MKVELIPLEGIALDGKAIRLGGTKADVTQALGSAGTVRQNSLYYFSNELRVDFDGKGRVEFIELLGGPDGALQPVIFDVGAFQADPGTVAALLKERNGGDMTDGENGHCLQFWKLSVGLYRESVPEDVAGMIEEAAANGHPLGEEEIEDEKRRTHWAAIGVGAEGYYG